MEMEISLKENMKVEARWNGFSVVADQPTENGGDNSAPSPFDYFLISIGQCAAFYVLSFCRERGISTDNLKIIQRIVQDLDTHMVSDIIIEIKLPPDFPARYKKAVMKAADTCTVKKHLLKPPNFFIKTSAG